MVTTTRIDRQGRLVVPASERRRLGLGPDHELRIVPTAEGLVLEPLVEVTVHTGEDGLATATIDGVDQIRNEDVLEAIHRDRDAAS